MSHEAADRLGELIWRTIKIRISLLALGIIVLLVVWSSLLTGDQQALELDRTFCHQLSDDAKRDLPTGTPFWELACDTDSARVSTESSRYFAQAYSAICGVWLRLLWFEVE
jgi:hypothetical protein